MIAILFLMSWISLVASAFHDPPVSIATGMKTWILVMPVYFVFLAIAALPAAPACKECIKVGLCVRICYSCVPSHRFATSSRYQRCVIWTFGVFAWHTHWLLGSWYLSLLHCSPYYVVDHSMADVSRSTLLACKAVQTSSFNLSATHACMGLHVLNPRRCPTVTMMASSDSRRPKEGIDVTFSQFPAWTAPAAFSLALSILLLHRLRRSS